MALPTNTPSGICNSSHAAMSQNVSVMLPLRRFCDGCRFLRIRRVSAAVGSDLHCRQVVVQKPEVMRPHPQTTSRNLKLNQCQARKASRCAELMFVPFRNRNRYQVLIFEMCYAQVSTCVAYCSRRRIAL